MKREERLQLNNLSKLLYGTSSKWQKMVNRGEVADLTETLEDGTVRKYRGISRYTVEEVKDLMAELWKEEQEKIARDEAEKKAAELTAKNEQALSELTKEGTTENVGIEEVKPS